MNKTFVISFCWVLLLLSCRKSGFINSPQASVLMADTIRFDTVFTTIGSVTQKFTIVNDNRQKLKLSSVKLAGGTQSPFKINIDGLAASEAADIEIKAGDSVYIFVSVTINPTAADLPFVVEDSIAVSYNGTQRLVQLRAYGQNAHFLQKEIITQTTTWVNDRPYVIIGGIEIAEEKTLTIEKGCRIYLQADAPFVVKGSLRINGTKEEQVVFQGDRLDEGYKDLPAAWPGIFFSQESQQNLLKYAVIKNAYQGIISVGPGSGTDPKLDLTESIVDNIYDIGLWGVSSAIRAVNCRITNCGANIVLQGGGSYAFTYSTVASYANSYIEHKLPVLSLTDVDAASNAYPLAVHFTNCIFWGEGGNIDEEVQVNRMGNEPFSVVLDHSLYKAKQISALITLNNSIENQNPAFDSINTSRRYFDFHIGQKPSPAIAAGTVVPYGTDLDGRERTGLPDLGCYTKP